MQTISTRDWREVRKMVLGTEHIDGARSILSGERNTVQWKMGIGESRSDEFKNGLGVVYK